MELPEINYFESLPPEVVTTILIKLSCNDILNVCQLSRYLWSFCDSWEFWADKVHAEFGFPKHWFLQLSESRKPRQFYLVLARLHRNPVEWLIDIIGLNRWAIGLERLALVKYILPKASKNLKELNFFLVTATLWGNVPLIDYFKSQGAKYERITDELVDVAEGGLLDRVKDLIAQGADNFDEAFEGAVIKCQFPVIQYFVETQRAHLDLDGRLFDAAFTGNLNIIQYLISQGAQVTPEVIGTAEYGDRTEAVAYLKSLQG